jgi:hypothetical protein
MLMLSAAFLTGPRAAVVLSVLQHATMLLVTIGYHIAGAESMAYIAGEICKVRSGFMKLLQILGLEFKPST